MFTQEPVTANNFCDAFLASYSMVRARFADDKRWQEIFTTRAWNTIMLWQPTATYYPPQEIELSVLAETAKKLGICYANGEPLRIDAVFSTEKCWFPILVAIEHENDWRGFESEIRKLLSIRSTLKVGITYTGDTPKGHQYREKLARTIEEDFAEVSLVIGEDPKTEYLFLVGAESEKQEISCWYSLHFRADTGPRNRRFEPTAQATRKAA